MTASLTFIAASSGDDKTRADAERLDRARLRRWAEVRPARPDFDALGRVWASGLAEPTEEFFDLIAPRDAFPRSPADGSAGLLPGVDLVAHPDPRGANGEHQLCRVHRGTAGLLWSVTTCETIADRWEAWHAGLSAVEHSRAGFTLLNRTPSETDQRLFSAIGLKCVVHPNGAGAWAWGLWGGDGIPRGASGCTKAEALHQAQGCVACDGETRITNFVPLSREDWRTLYAV